VERLDGHFWRPDGWSLVVRTGSGYVRTRAATNSRTVRILVRTRATCPHGSEVARVRTALIYRPDGDPKGTTTSWSPHILSTPPKSFLLASCELFLASFWLYLPVSFLCAFLSHSRYFSSLFLFSLFLTVGICISFRNVVEIFGMHISAVLGLVVCFFIIIIYCCYNFCVT
jgi:hypothetical protein